MNRSKVLGSVNVFFLVGLFFIFLFGIQSNEFGATWDEFLYYKGVRGVVNHGAEVIKGNNPETGMIFGDLALFGHITRFLPYMLSKLNSIQVENLEYLTDAQKFILGSFPSLNHLSAVVAGVLTAIVVSRIWVEYGSKFQAVIYTVLLMAYPEWSGSLYFNNSDVPLGLFFTCFSLAWAVQTYLVLRNYSCRGRLVKWSLFSGIWMALCISARPGTLAFLGVYYILTAAILAKRANRRVSINGIKAVTISWATAICLFYALYPQGWNRAPWQSIYDSIYYLSSRQKGGIAESASYVVNELMEGMPGIYIVGFIVGAVFVLIKCGKAFSAGPDNETEKTGIMNWICISMSLQAIMPLCMVVITGTVLYGRLRHIMFVFPAAVFIAAMGIAVMLKNKEYVGSKVLRALTMVILLLTIVEVALLSPYQYLYKSDYSRVINMIKRDRGPDSGQKSVVYADYYGVSQKRIFDICVRNSECLENLVNNRNGIRQPNGETPDSGSFNAELFEASRLLFLKSESLSIDNNAVDSHFLLKTNKSEIDDERYCEKVDGFGRLSIIPIQRNEIASLHKCIE